MKAQLQRKKDMFEKHIPNLEKALKHATGKVNKSNVEKMDLQQQQQQQQLTDSYVVQEEMAEKLKYMQW